MNNKCNFHCCPLFPDPLALESNLNSSRYLPTVYHEYERDWSLSAQFLLNYKYAYETYKSYRRDIERFLLWNWIVLQTPVSEIQVSHMQKYIDFVKAIPEHWTMKHHCRRYIDEDQALINELWRPFLLIEPNKILNIKSMLAILSSYFNYLIDHDYIRKNPLKLLKQKRHLITHTSNARVIRKLSNDQWKQVIKIADERKEISWLDMRNWWMLGIFYLLGLRISEVSVTVRHNPTMSDFWLDEEGNWWFKALGKGNKFREIAVPAELIAMLGIVRQSLSLPIRIIVGEQTPLMSKLNFKGGIGIRQVRQCVFICFQRASEQLRLEGKEHDADHLDQATVHWLRHTSISDAVKYRPIEHVRDDAGHSSIMITDIYINSDRLERHATAQRKSLNGFEVLDSTK